VTKVVVSRLNRRPKVAAKVRHVRGADGRLKTVPTLDAASPSFGEELLSVFARNVRKARRDNKRILGSADIAPRKA
jgi:hypothetical protein